MRDVDELLGELRRSQRRFRCRRFQHPPAQDDRFADGQKRVAVCTDGLLDATVCSDDCSGQPSDLDADDLRLADDLTPNEVTGRPPQSIDDESKILPDALWRSEQVDCRLQATVDDSEQARSSKDGAGGREVAGKCGEVGVVGSEERVRELESAGALEGASRKSRTEGAP